MITKRKLAFQFLNALWGRGSPENVDSVPLREHGSGLCIQLHRQNEISVREEFSIVPTLGDIKTTLDYFATKGMQAIYPRFMTDASPATF